MATYYVDFSAANDGDGSVYTQAAGAGQPGAFNTLVGHLGSVADVFWIRRVAKASNTSVINFNVDNVKYIGWPVSGDDYYTTRPDDPKVTWDADVATYAQLEYSSTSVAYTVSGGTSQEFHRIYFLATGSQHTVQTTVNAIFKNCYFSYTGTTGDRGAIYFLAGSYYDCVAKSYSNLGTSSSAYSIYAGTNTIYMKGCTTDIAGSNNTHGMYINWTSATCNLSLVNCTFKGNGNGHGLAIVVPSNQNIQGDHFIYGCFFYGGSGSGANSKGLSYNVSSNIRTFVFLNNAIKSGSGLSINGSTTFSGGNSDVPWHFSEITQTVASSTYGIHILAGVTFPIYVENFTAYAGNTSGDIYSDSAVYIRNCVLLHATEAAISAYSNKSVYMLDYAGVKGAWKMYGTSCTITADSSYRTGGESFSIKMTPTAPPAVADGIIGWIGTPGRETIFAAVTAGTQTITLYGAHKGWTTAPTQADLWFEGAYYADGSGATVTNLSTRDLTTMATLTTDTSTWNGDSGLTIFKLTITLTVGQDSIVPIRIFLSRYDSGAYLYIDPKPVMS